MTESLAAKTAQICPGGSPPLRPKWASLGTACCLASALGYTVVNACKRLLTVHCDRPMMLCVQDSVSVAVVGAWLLWQARRGTGGGSAAAGAGRRGPGGPGQPIPRQPAGPVGHERRGPGGDDYRPCTDGPGGGRLLSRLFLGEQVSLRSAAAVALLIASVIWIGFGTGPTNDSLTASADAVHGPFLVAS